MIKSKIWPGQGDYRSDDKGIFDQANYRLNGFLYGFDLDSGFS